MKYLLFLATAILVACSSTNVEHLESDIHNYATQSFIGHGVQWSAYPHADSKTAEWGALMTDEKWQMNYDRLDFMQPHIIRVVDQANWRYLKGFDKDGEAILSFDNEEVESLFKLLDYCQTRNVPVMIGEWGAPYQVHDVDSEFHGEIMDARDPRWLAMITEWIDFLINEKGYTCLTYYNLVNEVNGSWASTDGDWDEWKEAILALHQNFKKKGMLDHIQIIGPDVVPYKCNSLYDGAEWVLKSVKELDSIIACYDVHNYPHPDEIQSGEFQAYYEPLVQAVNKVDKPFILGELGSFKDIEENKVRCKAKPFTSKDSQMKVYDFIYGIEMADALIQSMNAGLDGAIAWDLDDAMHTMDDCGDKNLLKRWGFWNSLGTELCNDPVDEQIRPWFYTWSLMCREFDTGMNIVKVTPSSQFGVRYIVGHNDHKMTLAFANNSDTAVAVEIKLDGGVKTATYDCYNYFESDYDVDDNGYPVVSEVKKLSFAKGECIELPANSFILMTSELK